LFLWMQREYPVLYEFQAVKPSRSLNQEIKRTLSITKHLLIESSENDIINVHRSLSYFSSFIWPCLAFPSFKYILICKRFCIWGMPVASRFFYCVFWGVTAFQERLGAPLSLVPVHMAWIINNSFILMNFQATVLGRTLVMYSFLCRIGCLCP